MTGPLVSSVSTSSMAVPPLSSGQAPSTGAIFQQLKRQVEGLASVVQVEGSGLQQDLRSLGAVVQQQVEGLQAVSHLTQVMWSTGSNWEHRFGTMGSGVSNLRGHWEGAAREGTPARAPAPTQVLPV